MFIVPLTQLPSMIKVEDTNLAVTALSGTAKTPFADILHNAVENARQTQAAANRDAYDLAVGNTDNLAAVMINSAKAATALETTVQLTSRAVSAYKEIMQMQV